jgi:2-oxoglutarate ferredoxin oxidoreductase subunit beta
MSRITLKPDVTRKNARPEERPSYADYLDEKALPLMWCPGCGGGNILKALLASMAALGLPREKTVVVTGIGCWGKADDYVTTNAVHGTHGRALAVATGIKAYRPELTVVALMGDGDCATIGGNHFIHAARRNIGVTAIVANNLNYGMTGGQYSGTTPAGSKTSTSPYGHAEEGFDLCDLAAAAGANYVARTTAYHYRQMERLITEALTEKGFALVEVVSPCPTYYGRFNRQGDAAAMWRSLKDRAKDAGDGGSEVEGSFTVGRLVKRDRPSFSERYAEVQRRAMAEAGTEAEPDGR